tara:strand:- start:2152 stop:2679 length:528 start_codon:yes stop_codon:yes gene_type:complete
MNTIKKIGFLIIVVFTVQACGVKVNYNLTGGSTGDAKTFQVNFFQNYASQSAGSTVEPGLDRDFTQALQELLTNQTSLSLTNSSGDLVYEGEIIEYRISPMTATAQQTAAQNRLTMAVKVRFFNKTKEDTDFEQRFSFYFDYPANSLLQSVKDEAHQEIFERITQDIFNKSLADW